MRSEQHHVHTKVKPTEQHTVQPMKPKRQRVASGMVVLLRPCANDRAHEKVTNAAVHENTQVPQPNAQAHAAEPLICPAAQAQRRQHCSSKLKEAKPEERTGTNVREKHCIRRRAFFSTHHPNSPLDYLFEANPRKSHVATVGRALSNKPQVARQPKPHRAHPKATK